MKREDLYRSRGQRLTTPSRTRIKRDQKENREHYPICRFWQLAIAMILLMVIAGSRFLFPTAISDQIQSGVKEKIENTILLPTQEWNGSLKELLFTEDLPAE